MKTVLLVSTLFASAAMADIALPPQQNYNSYRYTGQQAQTLYNSLNVSERLEYQLRTTRSYMKILRDVNGRFEFDCNKSFILDTPDRVAYSCEVKTTKDGTPVPAYQFRHPLG